jgi:Fur family zinc uptake transcriptional regulator
MAEATASVEQQLGAAELACTRRGAQLTELRRQVLRLILESDAPLGAYALLDRLKADRPGAAPPTIYRALDFLQEQGLVHKVERLNAYVGCTDAGHAHHHHGDHDHDHQFLICGRCGATTELTDHAVAHAISAAAAKAGFAVTKTTVEIEGVCALCTASQG